MNQRKEVTEDCKKSLWSCISGPSWSPLLASHHPAFSLDHALYLPTPSHTRFFGCLLALSLFSFSEDAFMQHFFASEILVRLFA
jgi:hypothetical protein